MYMHSLETEHWSWVAEHEQLTNYNDQQTQSIDDLIDIISNTNLNEDGE